MDKNQENFIKKLVAFRKEHKISQAKLAELCDVSNGTIGNIESGVTKPSFDLIFKLAESLEIKAKDLFDFEETILSPEEFSENQLKTVQDIVDKAILTALDSVKNSVDASIKTFNITHPKKNNLEN